MKLRTIASVIPAAVLLFSHLSAASIQRELTSWPDTQLSSLANRLGRELSKVTTPEVEQRKQVRRGVQRSGYQNSLMELLRGDSLGSLLAFLRMRLQIEFFLPHNTIYVYQYLGSLYLAVPIVFRLDDGTELTFETRRVKLSVKENWSFPVDPWKEEER